MDYKEGEVTGTRWHRFSRVSVINPMGGSPTVNCLEQEVMSVSDENIVRDIGGLDFVFDPDAEIIVLDPATNEATGEIVTGARVQQLVFSYVLSEAKKRDEAKSVPQVSP